MKRLFKWVFRIVAVVVVLTAAPAAFLALSCTADYDENQAVVAPPYSEDVAAHLATVEDYRRKEIWTYMSFPEWFIVYVSQDFGAFITDNRPSGFPYFASVFDFWSSYCAVTEATTRRYPMDWGAHTVIYVIGVSHSAEYLIKGVYENIFGRLFELLAFGATTEEDKYAAKVASDYGEFLNTTPWYEFPFGDKLSGLWEDTDLTGSGLIRKWERKIVLSLEYGFKTVYGNLIKSATGATFAPPKLDIMLVLGSAEKAQVMIDPRVEHLKEFDGGFHLVRIPRYEVFSKILAKWAAADVPIVDISGNDDMLITAFMRESEKVEAVGLVPMFNMTVATRPGRERQGYTAKVPQLSEAIQAVTAAGGEFEHAYDY